MSIYFIFFTILLVLSSLEIFFPFQKARDKKNSLFLVFVLSVIIVGFRWETGTDWHPYHEMFRQSYSLANSFNFSLIVEPGYLFLNWLCYFISSDYSFFLVVHAIIFYYFIIYGLAKVSPYPITAYMFFFMANIGVVGSNRQLLALALVFYFLTWAYERKKSFFWIVFAAMQFHTTALLCACFYFFNRKVKLFYIVIILLVGAAIGFSGLPMKLFALIGGGFGEAGEHRVKAYSEVNSAELSVIGFIRRILYVVFFLVIRTRVEGKYKFYNFFLNSYLFSLLIYLMFSSSLIILVNRGSLYFNIAEGILFASVFLILSRQDSKLMFLIIVAILSVLSFYQSISPYPDLFDPYKGLWFNMDYFRIMH